MGKTINMVFKSGSGVTDSESRGVVTQTASMVKVGVAQLKLQALY